ncbi:hypothetical protein D3C87_1668060 [compost metagenome]
MRHIGRLRGLLQLLDGFLGGFHLAGRVGLVEACVSFHFRHQGLGLVDHFFARGDWQIQLLGDFRQMLVGGGAVVDDDDGVILDLFGLGQLVRQATGFDVGHAFGRGIIDEFGRGLGKGTAGTQAQ